MTLFDTANVYGTGHSEHIIGKALHGKGDEVVLATKVGQRHDRGVAGDRRSTAEQATERVLQVAFPLLG
ncbi:MAG: aldo/keto reductase [Acidimicrobiia bacterium]|nr:aldo/keto reductase [Acidimicrobiia bacterium]